MSKIFGVDIGGSSIKMGCFDITTEETTDTISIPLPSPTTPSNIFEAVKYYIPKDCAAVGFGVPSIVKNGTMLTGPRLDPAWRSSDVQSIAESTLKMPCAFLNDADAAAMAEIRFGTMKNLDGVTVFLTLGTGIGTAIYYNKQLLLNTEFGRMALPGGIDNAENIAAAVVKTVNNLTWEQYAHNVNIYLKEINKHFWPDHVVIGGGVSDNWDNWAHHLSAPFEIHKATFGNTAGIIGAAIYSYENSNAFTS